MIRREIKLKLTKEQERKCETFLFRATDIYNWVIRKIEQDSKYGIYWSVFDFNYMIIGHSKKCGVPSMMIQGTIATAHQAWNRYIKNLCGKPRLKSYRNRLNGIDIYKDVRFYENFKVKITGLGRVGYHKNSIPSGKINVCRLMKKASGWYLSVCIEAEPQPIKRVSECAVGIDPGFSSLITLSDGTKIDHPRELEASANALARAQRGGNRKLASRIHERVANQRRDRNHKLSRKLVSENSIIVFSADRHKAIAKIFGKSVASSAHAQLRSMLAYKSRIGGTQYIEVDSRYSTRTCSACGSLSGPSGFAGLSVREWVCADCGTAQDRDVNAALNTLILGASSALGTGIAGKELWAKNESGLTKEII